MMTRREIEAKIAINEFEICKLEGEIETLQKKILQYTEMNTELENQRNDGDGYTDLEDRYGMED